MMALTMALVSQAVPKERTGIAMGLLATMSAVGTALGPSLGGALIAWFDWRYLFLINVPLGIATYLLARASLPHDVPRQSGATARFDRDRHGTAGRYAAGLYPCCHTRARPCRADQRGPACR